jgi:hypothetical protein
MAGIRYLATRAILVMAVLSLAPGCSVKEDRIECPVYVTVLTDEFVRLGMNEGLVSFSGTRVIDREDVSFLSILRSGYKQACPREFARAAVFSGAENYILVEESMRVLPGCQAGLLWAYGESFSAKSDEYVIDATPHKQYCLVQFLFDDSPTAAPDYPWRFRIRAACSGMDIYTLEPLEGDYSACVGPNAVGAWYGVIPRQKSNDLLLEVYLPEEGHEDRGRIDYVIDLGAKFEAMGYDWTAEDLRDVSVKVGFASAGITVSVQDWEGDNSYENIEI